MIHTVTRGETARDLRVAARDRANGGASPTWHRVGRIKCSVRAACARLPLPANQRSGKGTLEDGLDCSFAENRQEWSALPFPVRYGCAFPPPAF